MSEPLNSRQRRKMEAEAHQRQREKDAEERAARIAARAKSKPAPPNLLVESVMLATASVGVQLSKVLFSSARSHGKY